MKFKPSAKTGQVTLELEAREAELPPVPLPEVNLKKILVPIDFSESSRKALHYAMSLAKQFHAEILLLHVVEIVTPSPAVTFPESESLNVKLHEEAAKRLSEWRHEVVSHAAVKAAVRGGIPYRDIVAAADESNIDLIILGTHGRTGLAHLLIGSTAERVVRHAPCPVMVVREREHDFVEPTAAKTRSSSAQTQIGKGKGSRKNWSALRR